MESSLKRSFENALLESALDGFGCYDTEYVQMCYKYLPDCCLTGKRLVN